MQNEFVPVAIDQAYQRRQKDAEGRFYQKIANQGPRKIGDGGPTTQGHYIAAPDGTFFDYNNNRDPEHLRDILRKSLTRYEPEKIAPIQPGKPDPKFVYGPPEGGFVVRVHSRILGGYEATDNPMRRIFQNGTGRDNLWIRKDEHASLLQGDLPESLVTRMLRFHFVDNTRGEPPMWEESEILKSDLMLDDGKITGSIQLANKKRNREFRADVLGFVDTEDGHVSRFDLLAKGQFQGEGRYTRGAPKGKFPLAIAFTLADGSDIADTVPPQGSRGWLDGYIQ